MELRIDVMKADDGMYETIFYTDSEYGELHYRAAFAVHFNKWKKADKLDYIDSVKEHFKNAIKKMES